MRRIYDSDALRRGENPHEPTEAAVDDDGDRIVGNRHQSMLDWASASHALVPTAFRDRSIAVSVRTDRDEYAPGEDVSVRVTMRNRLPVPIVLRTPTPVRWGWSVDGVRSASRVSDCDPPDRPTLFEFRRGERKTFDRTWHQTFRATDGEWTDADEGRHEIAAFVDVEDPGERGLRATTTVEIRS